MVRQVGLCGWFDIFCSTEEQVPCFAAIQVERVARKRNLYLNNSLSRVFRLKATSPRSQEAKSPKPQELINAHPPLLQRRPQDRVPFSFMSETTPIWGP